jgi:hypothetical protein
LGRAAILAPIKIRAPSPASASCLLGDLAPSMPAQLVDDGDGGLELLVESTSADGLKRVLATVSDWLRTCNLPSTEIEADGRRYTVTP